MKRTKVRALFFVIACLIGFAMQLNTVQAAGDKGYWSEKNAPEFYGTTKIVIKKGSEFSLKDTKYRIFARDFEDFDLTNKIVATHNVNPEESGEYSIQYSVTDHHGNTTKLKVPVLVTEEEGNSSMIERTMYTLPSVSNISAMGIGRGDNHDRQMLGLFVKADASLQIRKVSGSSNLTYTMLNNNSKNEGSKTITSEWQTITFGNDYTPFIKTLYNQTEPVKVEIAWDSEDTKIASLNYYHEGDEEEVFFSKWESEKESYAVIEGEAITVLVPYADRGKLINYWKKCFHSLEEFLIFWKKTTDAYDQMLGLEYAPEENVDQNVKSRYFVRANASGGGAAYYAGDHVGINNVSVASFFEVNWGGLHEFGHGYQGTLGKGDLNIGEVSNNVFGHYVQINKEIYPYNDDWLGKLPNIEEKYNLLHQQGKAFLDLDVVGKLYFMINFLDSFGGPDTYQAIAKEYRRAVVNKQAMSSQDAWVLGIYKAYGVNLTNYFESWGIPISKEIKIKLSKTDAKNAYALQDIIGSKQLTEQVASDLGLSANYQLVTNDQLAAYGLNGSVTVRFTIDDFSELEGRYVYLKDGNKQVAREKIKGTTVTFSNIPVGSYTISAPELIAAYSKQEQSVLVLDHKTTETTVTYQKEENTFSNDVMIQFQGHYYKDAAQITLDRTKNGLNLHFRYRGTTLFNGGLPADHEYAKIQVLDENGTECYKKVVGGAKQMFSTVNLETLDLAVKEGYKIILKYDSAKDNLRFISRLNGDERIAYEIADRKAEAKEHQKEAVYLITKDGIQKETFTEEEDYKERSQRADTYIKTGLSGLTEEDLFDKTVEPEKKTNIVYAYRTLRSEDQKEYSATIDKILNGHRPVLTVNGQTGPFYINDVIDIASFVSAADKEDGAISSEEIQITTNLNSKKAGTYTVTYMVSDSDRNTTTKTIKVTVVEIPEITLDKKKATLYTDMSATLKVTGGIPGRTVTWKSSDSKIASVDKKGMVTPKKAGTVTITATLDGKSASCVFTIKKAEITLNASTKILTTSKAKTVTLKAMVNGKNPEKNSIRWTSSNTKVASVNSSSGKVTAKKTGTATITATSKNGLKATCKIIVNPKLTLKKTSATIKVNGTVRIQATVTPAKSEILYKVEHQKIATVSKNGTVKGKKKGKTTVTVTANGVKKKFIVTVK